MQKSDLPEEEKERKWNKYPTIEEQREHFKEYSLLPLGIGILIFIICLIGGIATAVTTQEVGVFFAGAASGAIGGALSFVILRILISSQILTVLYLEKISNDIEDMKKSGADGQSEKFAQEKQD